MEDPGQAGIPQNSVITSKQTRDIDPRLGKRWASVVDAGSTLNQPWASSSRLKVAEQNRLIHPEVPGMPTLLCGINASHR